MPRVIATQTIIAEVILSPGVIVTEMVNKVTTSLPGDLNNIEVYDQPFRCLSGAARRE